LKRVVLEASPPCNFHWHPDLLSSNLADRCKGSISASSSGNLILFRACKMKEPFSFWWCIISNASPFYERSHRGWLALHEPIKRWITFTSGSLSSTVCKCGIQPKELRGVPKHLRWVSARWVPSTGVLWTLLMSAQKSILSAPQCKGKVRSCSWPVRNSSEVPGPSLVPSSHHSDFPDHTQLRRLLHLWHPVFLAAYYIHALSASP